MKQRDNENGGKFWEMRKKFGKWEKMRSWKNEKILGSVKNLRINGKFENCENLEKKFENGKNFGKLIRNYGNLEKWKNFEK
jgi:hypothetical protein